MVLKYSSAGRGLDSLSRISRISGMWWRVWLVVTGLVSGALTGQAQWLTQTNLIAPGWTAVYFYVDGSIQNLDQLVGFDPGNPIDQIWLWRSASAPAQYLSNPAAPLSGGSQWLTWLRSPGGNPNTLEALVPNTAYLVHSFATTNYNWRVLGQPVPPSYSWDLTGLNFIGFSTPYVNPPNFQNYLAPAPAIASIVQLYQYVGGALGPNNPQPVFSQYVTKVTRGQAFWVSATNINNNYFGPFQIRLLNPSGISFGDASSQSTLHLQNLTANNLTVTVRLLASETPPYGQTNITSPPPLLVEGGLNVTNLTYGATALATASSATATNTYGWTLAPAGQPGSDVQVVLGVNRFALTNGPGLLYAGILQFGDSLGFSEVDVPVTAVSASTAGLWVGSANVSQVGSYLKTYQTNSDGSLAMGNNGAYVVANLNTNLGAVPTPYPLRLIIHNDGTNCNLLQRVYYGLRENTNLVVATTESVLDVAHLNVARRITATSMPWTAANAPWPLSGQLALGGVLTGTVTEAYDDQAANPFLHTYHPDHNNLDPLTTHELPPGSESYNISRTITLAITPPGTDFGSLTTASTTLSGTYLEAISLGGLGGAARTFNTAGNFTLLRISPIATLTTQ